MFGGGCGNFVRGVVGMEMAIVLAGTLARWHPSHEAGRESEGTLRLAGRWHGLYKAPSPRKIPLRDVPDAVALAA